MKVLMHVINEHEDDLSYVIENGDYLSLVKGKDNQVTLYVNDICVVMKDPSLWISTSTYIAYEPNEYEKDTYVGECGRRHVEYDNIFDIMCDMEDEPGWWKIEVNHINNTLDIHFMVDEFVIMDNVNQYIKTTFQYEKGFCTTKDVNVGDQSIRVVVSNENLFEHYKNDKLAQLSKKK